IEDADVVEPEKPAFKNIVVAGVLAIDPPREIQEQLMENAFQKVDIALSCGATLDVVHAPCRPCVYRWIHVGEIPFVCRDLSVRVHVPLAQEKCELEFGKYRIDQRKR